MQTQMTYSALESKEESTVLLYRKDIAERAEYSWPLTLNQGQLSSQMVQAPSARVLAVHAHQDPPGVESALIA